METGVAKLTAEPGQASIATEVEYIYRVAYRLTGDPHDAEDLVQDVCERALRKGPEFAAADDRRRWLLRVLHNRFVDGRRRNGRSPVVESPAGDLPEATPGTGMPDPQELAQQADGESALMRAWARLEPAQQMLLLLRAEGHDLDEIARITACDKPVLSSRLHRARLSLARYLDDEGAMSAPGQNPKHRPKKIPEKER
jgi:RNA polymerase sigma-70 factor (ECF subfamily)